MKRLILAALLIGLFALPSEAQQVCFGSSCSGGGGGAASGSPITGCTAYSIVRIDSAGNLACTPNPVVNGSVSTAGRSILTIRDTATSGQAFLDVTGTLNGTLSGTTSGALFTTTLDNDNQLQAGIRSLTAGAAGTLTSAAVWGDNGSTGSVGVGVYGISSAAATARVGGFFGLGAVVPTTSGALVSDNGVVAANIFEARDNGTAKVTIADGGGVTLTQANLNVAEDYGIWFSGGWYPLLRYAGNMTPDSLMLALNDVSRGFNIIEMQDEGFDFQNSCTTGLGTSACTNPTLQIHSSNQDTGEFLSMAHDGKAGVVVGGDSTAMNGQIRLGGSVALPDTTATTVINVASASATGTGGTITYDVTANDATNAQARSGSIRYAVATNSSGTTTCAVYGVVTTQAAGGDTTNAANPTQVQDGSGVGAFSSGTLTYAWSVTAGTNTCAIKIGAISSLTETTMRIDYTVLHSGRGAVTGG